MKDLAKKSEGYCCIWCRFRSKKNLKAFTKVRRRQIDKKIIKLNHYN